MNTNIALHHRQVIAEIKYLPAVSIILPFQPVITPKSQLAHKLKLIMGIIEQRLVTLYPVEKAVPVIMKLKNLIRNLNYSTPKKSIAIFVSPVVEKVYYLEAEVDEKIAVDESFEIRDLVFSEKKTIQYLIMTLSDECSKMYVGNCSKFTLIKSNISGSAESHKNNFGKTIPDHICGSKHSYTLLNEFLVQMDQGLSIILKSYPLPVFILGTKRVLDQFKKITRNEKNITQFIEGSYEQFIEIEIQNALLPYELDWKRVKQKYLLNQIEIAKEENKLAIGIDQVWRTAIQNKGMLLILETKYAKSPQPERRNESFYKIDYLCGNPFYIKNEVDEIIEKVFESGGDVEFTEKGTLKEYDHIALIGKLLKYEINICRSFNIQAHLP